MISIIIPAYNVENYIVPCLDSLAAQTYSDIEIIVVDDGSTDGTPDLLDAYAKKDERIRVIHKENEGVTSARLCGLKACSGQWIGFVDGDDLVEPEMYERLLGNAVHHDADISHCGYQMVFPDHTDYYYNTGRLINENGREALKGIVSGAFEPGLCNKLYCRRLLDGLLNRGIMDCSIRINEDLLMNYYLFREAGSAVFEDFCPYHYMVHKGSAANSTLRPYKLNDQLKVRRKMVEESVGDEELCSLCRQSLIQRLISIASMSAGNYSEEIRTCIKEARRELRKQTRILQRDSYAFAKIKAQATWAAMWPASYGLIHSLYGVITGATHKYDIKQ